MDSIEKGRATPKFVLIVEDEPILSMVAADHFSDAGYEVAEAASVEDAIPLLESCPVSVLFTDIRMAGIDGIGLATIVASKRPDIRLIITSGAQHPSDRRMPANVMFFAKPYDLHTIIAALA